MSNIGWTADGIERARAAGGIDLEVYRKPGFTGGMAIRRSFDGAGGSGFEIEADPEPWDEDED